MILIDWNRRDIERSKETCLILHGELKSSFGNKEDFVVQGMIMDGYLLRPWAGEC